MIDPIDTWQSALTGACVLALVWALVWSVPAVIMRRNDLADVVWGLIFPMLTLLVGGSIVAPDWQAMTRTTVVVVFVSIWGLRLAIHIGRRTLGHAVEDKRYAQMRAAWGTRWRLRSVLQVFVLQAGIAVIVSQPLLIAVVIYEGDASLGWIDAAAIVLFCTGFALEAIADRQLRRFLVRKQAGEVDGYLTTGVWAWSRHPNYAGDAILWWGFGLFGVAAALDAGAEILIIPSLLGPLVMTLFLRYGSGVPMTERGRAGTPAWDAYVARTSAFLPRPPRKSG